MHLVGHPLTLSKLGIIDVSLSLAHALQHHQVIVDLWIQARRVRPRRECLARTDRYRHLLLQLAQIVVRASVRACLLGVSQLV